MEPDANGERGPVPLVSRVRAFANVVTLIGAVTFAMLLPFHPPERVMAYVGLLTLAAFALSFFSILAENRRANRSNGEAP